VRERYERHVDAKAQRGCESRLHPPRAAGLFGEDLFVRLPDDEAEAIRKQGGRSFEPMAGHAMKGYVTVPSTWRSKPSATHHFIVSALAFTRTLPPKSASGKQAPSTKASRKASANKASGRK
jgi:hypothetical protein